MATGQGRSDRASRTTWWIPVAVAFVLLTLTVMAGATAGADEAVRDVMRPQDVWGANQVAADVVVEGLRSEVVIMIMLMVGAVLSVVRRAWTPVAHTALLAVMAAVSTVVVKLSLHRTDPHHDLSSIGSFPSGHVTFVLVGLGGMLVASGVRIGWKHWAVVAAATITMGVSLLLQAAHWGSDVLGGVLLGLLVLGAADHVVRRVRHASLEEAVTPPRGTACTPPTTARDGRAR